MTPEEKEMLRHAALEALTLRHPAAVARRAVGRHVATSVPFKVPDEELDSALSLLEDKHLIESTVDELGSTKWYRATAAGLLHTERQ